MVRYILSVTIGCLLCASSFAANVKFVTGTWLNLVWQDERNNYMNPTDIDNTDPEFWENKLEALHDMGIDCLVLMQVANDGKAFYPSSVMPPAYDTRRMSPVETIVRTAEKLSMKLFLSCGWARNQDDDLRDPFVIERQQQIMQELVALYSTSPAFYGWYLPVESSFEPVLPEHAVQGVNSLSAKARALTPDKLVMISPYGICNADMDNPLFEERIAALDVDVIAYQDEVGCVREPMPLPRMKEHFRKLGEIHKRTGIAFWANIESFTWEKPATNSRQSALVPAAFGRYLSQIAAVSEAGVEKILSFAVAGIYDSGAARDEYMQWKRGEGRWKLLEHIFTNDVSSLTAHSADAALSSLFDGRSGQENVYDPSWTTFADGHMTVVADLGNRIRIERVVAKFLNYKASGVSLPEKLLFSFSNDGVNFGKCVVVQPEKPNNDLHDCWTDIVLCNKIRRARFVKVEAFAPEGYALMCDEILMNPSFREKAEPSVGLTLIPPGAISDKVDLDIRAGIVNKNSSTTDFKVRIIARKGLWRKVLKKDCFTLDAGASAELRTVMGTAGLKGGYKIILKLRTSEGRCRLSKATEVIPSEQRSLARISGAWTGFYHWSELEGRHWNNDIRTLSSQQWKAVVRSMHEVGMDIVVVQELFRSDEKGRRSYYPSGLCDERMDIACPDPLEAIMTEADSLGMQVFPGIGLFEWFDFSNRSLQWHKQVAGEVWERYGRHPSFYGFYVSEESGGSLDKWETDSLRRELRRGEIIKFFSELGNWCHSFAPGRPLMLATNSFDVKSAGSAYMKLLEHLDILCPFGFARMPESDISGKEAADFLQSLCDRTSCHLWFDLEAFLFYPDGSLYPRDFEGVLRDLKQFGNFEKTLCYQYPGVFNNPEMHPQIGEAAGIELYGKYKSYCNQ